MNNVVEIFLIDEGTTFDLSHPIHIHGYSPYIVAMERHAAFPDQFYGGPTSPRTLSKLCINPIALKV